MSKGYSGGDFKWNLIKYVSGRAANAITSFAIFLWIAKVLPTGQYAVYVAAYSVLEITLIVAGLGMEWVTVRFVPVAKVKASGRALIDLVVRCIAIQVGCLAVGGLAFWLLSPTLSNFLGIGDAADALALYALVMFLEGISRMFRDQLLSVLLLQGAAQTSQMFRNLTLLGLAAFAFQHTEYRTAEVMGLLECVASAASLLMGASFLAKSLHASRAKVQEEEWKSPTWRDMIKLGRDAWIGNLANLTWGPQVIILLVAKSAGTEATALLGFARNFSEYIRRYMPMEFLAGVFRTFVMVRYATDKNLVRMGAMLGLAYKINLLFLLPFIALIVVDGEDMLAIVGHGDYVGSRWLVVGWLLVTVAWAHRRISDLLAYTLDMSAVPRSVGLRLIVTPVLIYLCGRIFGLHSFYVVLFLAEAAYCGSVVRSVNKAIPAYQFDWPSMAKFLLGLGAAILVLHFTQFGKSAFYLTCNLILAAAVGYGVIVLLRAWTADEAALFSEMRTRSAKKAIV